MAEIQEQTQLANEVSEAISSNQFVGVEIDEVRTAEKIRPGRFALLYSIAYMMSFVTGRAQAGARGPRAGRAQRKGGRPPSGTLTFLC